MAQHDPVVQGSHTIVQCARWKEIDRPGKLGGHYRNVLRQTGRIAVNILSMQQG